MVSTGTTYDFLLSMSAADIVARGVIDDPGVEKAYSYGGQAALQDHLDMLRAEFQGEPEVCFYHAVLIVLVRRRIALDDSVARFLHLWDRHREVCAQSLDSRWLVSACDTFVDHGRTGEERAFAILGSTLANTVKLYETERLADPRGRADGRYRQSDGRVSLHDGLSAFMIGRGDMIDNLMRRARVMADAATPSARIAREIMERLARHDTVFRRFAQARVEPDRADPAAG